MAKPRALIFDCDGTLITSARVYAKAWAEGFGLSGRQMDASWYMANHGLSECGLIGAFERLHGITVDQDAVVARMRAGFIERLSEVYENPPIARIARSLANTVPMAVASGGPRAIVEASLVATGLRHLFPHVVTYDDVGRAKPDPALFLEAARRLGVQPENCIAFEDSAVGIAAARDANMTVIDITDKSSLKVEDLLRTLCP